MIGWLFFCAYLVTVLIKVFFDYLNATVQTQPHERRRFQGMACQRLVNLLFFFGFFYGMGIANSLGVLAIGWMFVSLWVLIRFDLERHKTRRTRLKSLVRSALFRGALPLVFLVLFTALFFEEGPWLPYPVMGLLILLVIGVGYLVLFSLVIPRLFQKRRYIRPFDTAESPLKTPTLYLVKSRRIHLPINALYTGFFGRHSIWVSPALLGALTSHQIKGIIAHEIGHHKGGHLFSRVLFLIAVIALYLATGAFVFESRLVEVLGFPDSFISRLVMFMMLYHVVEGFVESCFYRLSQYQEFAADRYAVKMGLTAELAQSLFLIEHHQKEPRLHPFSRHWQFSHPATHHRIEALRQAGHLPEDLGFVFELTIRQRQPIKSVIHSAPPHTASESR